MCDIFIAVSDIFIAVCDIFIAVYDISVAVCDISVAVCDLNIAVCDLNIVVCDISIAVRDISIAKYGENKTIFIYLHILLHKYITKHLNKSNFYIFFQLGLFQLVNYLWIPILSLC